MNSIASVALAVLALGGGEWPGFLGAGTESPATEAIPLKWSPTENIAWTAELPGDGQSSPVVRNGLVFVTTVEGPDKDTCHLLAFALSDGTLKWKHSFPTSDKVKSSLYVSRAAPTPVCDDKAVYAFFESGDVAAVGLDGTALWHRSLSQEYGKFKNKFGLSASPVQTADSIIVLVDDEGPSYLTAMSKTDGKTLWKTDRTSRTSWSSPSLLTVGDKQQVVISSSGSVDGYDPTSGERLWSFDEVGGNTANTPIANQANWFLVGASQGREGGDRAEAAKQSNLAMTVDLVDGKLAPKVLWRNEAAMSSFGSPMIHAGHAYWVTRQGVVYCFDASTGEQRWSERTKQSCWATPLGVGDRVYFFGKDGVTTVLAAGPKYQLLAENELIDPAGLKPDPTKGQNEDTPEKRAGAANFSAPIQYGVAAVNDGLLIRTGSKLYCLRPSAK